MFVTDKEKKQRIGELYGQAFEQYKQMPMAIHYLHQDSQDSSLVASQTRSASSADYLAEHMGEAPVLFIPCIQGRTDDPAGGNILAQSAFFGSIIPAA